MTHGQSSGGCIVLTNPFFDRPVLNSPYEYPTRHWELDETGQPTQNFVESRRPAQFITPVPKPRKRRGKAEERTSVLFNEGRGLSTERQRYEHTALIDSVRRQVDRWCSIADPGRWQVTPETARLLRHWRSHRFSDVRPFFCQVEAVETAIWLTEVAPNAGETGRGFLDHLAGANDDANPELQRLALKLATGAGKIPRVPVADNVPGEDMPKLRNLWEHIRGKMPRRGRGKAKTLDPLSLPAELLTALDALYGHYEKVFRLWREADIGVPPCFIVVCNNTSTSKLVYDSATGEDLPRRLGDIRRRQLGLESTGTGCSVWPAMNGSSGFCLGRVGGKSRATGVRLSFPRPPTTVIPAKAGIHRFL